MPIADDWDFDYANQEIRHIDGILTYANNAGTAPSLNQYVRGTTSGAVGRVIGGSDLGGTNAAGTLTLTNVVGRFADTEAIEVLSEVPFDNVGGTPQGFTVGEVLTGPTTESITARAIEYNQGPKVTLAGEGVIYGNALTSGFANDEQIDNATTGATAVALVNGSETDNSGLFTSATVNGTLAVPGTTDTNNSVIIHYDSGTIDIPEDAKVADASTGASGFVQQKVGVTASGSLRLVDSDTSGGAWTNNNGLDIEDVVFFDAQVAGQVFLAGDLIEGQTSGVRFRVLAPIDDGDSTGKLITAGKTGALTIGEDLNKIEPGDVLGPKVAEVENGTTVLAAATLNLPNGVFTLQRNDQGGIYGESVSLNIRRSSNAFYSLAQDNIDELPELVDKPPLQGTFVDTVYTILDNNGWQIPDLSFRFLEKGGFTDASKNNIWTNDQSVMSLVLAQQSAGFLPDTANPTPLPDAYIEQNGEVLQQFWMHGDVNVLIKVKSTTDTRYIAPATPALGQEIDSGNRTWWLNEYLYEYDHFDTAKIGATNTVPLSTKNDINNNTGQYRYSFNTGGAGAFEVGEEITGASSGARGIVTFSDSGATGNVDYALKSTAQFQDSEVITGAVSGKSATLDVAGLSNLVAGYSSNIRTMVVDRRFTGGSTTGTFVIGETVTQTGTGATGFVLEDDGGTIYVQDDTGTFNGTGTLTGGVSGATNTPTATAAFTTVPKDIGDGSGDLNYSGVSSANITAASPQPILSVYEWDKFLTRKESLALQGGTGGVVAVEGRVYRSFNSSFPEIKVAPYGTFAGGAMFGAQGHFIQKETLISADLQKIQLTDNDGTVVTPPNLQAYLISNVGLGWRVGGYRSTGSQSTEILTTEFEIGAGNVAGNSVVVVQAGTRGVSPLPADVPDTGVLRVTDPNRPGIFLRVIYDSVNRTTNTFSLQQGIGQNTIGDITGGSGLTQGEDSFVVPIEEEATGSTVSNNLQYIGDINCVTLARKKGFQPFIAAGVFTSTGLSQGVVQTPDPTVNLP